MTSISTTKQGILTTLTVLSTAAVSHAEEQSGDFIAMIQSKDPEQQLQAWKIADRQPPEVIAALADMTISDDPSVEKAALECIGKIVHSVGKDPDDPKRQAVIDQLVSLLNREPVDVRVTALRLLSLIARGADAPRIAAWIQHPQLREEVVFCLERIPAPEATQTLIDLLKLVPDEFVPRILYALGHRQDKEAAPVIGEYLSSPDVNILTAALKAIGRIGVHPGIAPPPIESMPLRVKKAAFDSGLRFADKQIEQNNIDMAKSVLNQLYEGRENDLDDHYLCAGIIVAAKIDDPEVAKSVVKLLAHKHYIVRDTARRELIAMKSHYVDQLLQAALPQVQGELKTTIQSIIDARKK